MPISKELLMVSNLLKLKLRCKIQQHKIRVTADQNYIVNNISSNTTEVKTRTGSKQKLTKHNDRLALIEV